jgi:hypothetical protein
MLVHYKSKLREDQSMDFRKTMFDLKAAEAAARAGIDHLGGEPLAGSGFEDETPETGFLFDWALPIDPHQGGLQ